MLAQLGQPVLYYRHAMTEEWYKDARGDRERLASRDSGLFSLLRLVKQGAEAFTPRSFNELGVDHQERIGSVGTMGSLGIIGSVGVKCGVVL
jgi:hypothetical protein